MCTMWGTPYQDLCCPPKPCLLRLMESQHSRDQQQTQLCFKRWILISSFPSLQNSTLWIYLQSLMVPTASHTWQQQPTRTSKLAEEGVSFCWLGFTVKDIMLPWLELFIHISVVLCVLVRTHFVKFWRWPARTWWLRMVRPLYSWYHHDGQSSWQSQFDNALSALGLQSWSSPSGTCPGTLSARYRPDSKQG